MGYRTQRAQNLLQMLIKATDPGRLQRGRRYQSHDRITQFDISAGRVVARVRGNVNAYFGVKEAPVYEVEINYPQYTDQQWHDIIEKIRGNSSLMLSLLMQTLPEGIDDVCPQPLLIDRFEEVDSDCGCMDSYRPCKHMVGIWLSLMGILDDHPLEWLLLRGCHYTQLIKRLRPLAQGSIFEEMFAEQEALVTQQHFFPEVLPGPDPSMDQDFWSWQRHDLKTAHHHPSVMRMIKKQGDYPAFWSQETSFVDTMQAVYERVHRAKKAFLKA